MIYVIHGNKITFIVIVIVIVKLYVYVHPLNREYMYSSEELFQHS